MFTSIAVASPKRTGGDDVARVLKLSDGITMVILADGATGSGDGRLAAELFCQTCEELLTAFAPDQLIQEVFTVANQKISSLAQACDTTGIVLLVQEGEYALASVGDSKVWMLSDRELVELTSDQRKKPRIGNCCHAPSVRRGQVEGLLLVASDGLEYAMPLNDVIAVLQSSHADLAHAIVVKAQQLNPQGLPDDLGVIVIGRK